MNFNAFSTVMLPDGKAVVVEPMADSVLLEMINPQRPEFTLAHSELSYEMYACLRQDYPEVAYPELSPPELDDFGASIRAEVTEGKIHRNHYPQPGPIGNTVGLIVPRTQPAEPGAPSNPSVGAETEAEADWWDAVQRWWLAQGLNTVHKTLDVVGTMPGIGAVANLTNAGIYRYEENDEQAALSAVSAVPFGGIIVKVGKSANKAVNAWRTGKENVRTTNKAVNQNVQTDRDPVFQSTNIRAGKQMVHTLLRGREKAVTVVRKAKKFKMRKMPEEPLIKRWMKLPRTMAIEMLTISNAKIRWMGVMMFLLERTAKFTKGLVRVAVCLNGCIYTNQENNP